MTPRYHCTSFLISSSDNNALEHKYTVIVGIYSLPQYRVAVYRTCKHPAFISASLEISRMSHYLIIEVGIRRKIIHVANHRYYNQRAWVRY